MIFWFYILLKKYLFFKIQDPQKLRYKIYVMDEYQSMEKYADEERVSKNMFLNSWQ